MKQPVNVFDYAGDICKAMQKGILLTTAHDGQVNTMTIGWGIIGIEWGKPIFLALVRDSRYTKEMLDKNKEFTVNIPMGEVDKQILAFCGTKSGRDVDKIRELNLTLEQGEKISVPGILELPLTLECKVLYEQAQNPDEFPSAIQERYYPGIKQDYHIVYYGEIVSAYIITRD